MTKKIPASSVVALALALAAIWPEAVMAQISVLPSSNQNIGANADGSGGLDIANGEVHLRHIPGLILYWIQVLLQLVGTFAVIMIMVGGVQYMIGSVSNDKEQGKKTITYAVAGLVLAFFAWWIIELIQVWMTS